MRDDRARERGVRVDDVEFTFEKGRWGHLGEATLFNRIKSHPDVGERWYPDILDKIRREQAEAAGTKREEKEVKELGMDVGAGDGGHAIRAH